MNYNDRSELFKESSFFELFEWLNSDNFLSHVDLNRVMASDTLIEFLFSYPSLIKKIIKHNSLYFFTFYDFIKNKDDNNMLERDRQNVKTFYNTYNFEIIERLWETVKGNINIDALARRELIEDIEIRKEHYYHFLLNQSWLELPKFKYDVPRLAKQLIISYYDNIYYQDNSDINNFKFDSAEYNEFVKTTINPNYFDVFNLNEHNMIRYLNITVEELEEDENTSNKEIIKSYFGFLISIREVNKNILAWFFFYFYHDIPQESVKDYLFIIFNWKKNISGYILRLLDYLDIEYFKINNTFDDLIKSIEKDHDYLFKINEDLRLDMNNFNSEDVINNLYVLKSISNIRNEDLFTQSESLNTIENIEPKMFFNLNFINPLDDSPASLQLDIDAVFKDFIEKIDSLLEEIDEDSDKKRDETGEPDLVRSKEPTVNKFRRGVLLLKKIYNSTIIMKDSSKIKKIFSMNNNILFIDYPDFRDHYYDIDTLTYHMIQLLIAFEIIPIKNETLKKNIENKINISLQDLRNFYISLAKDNIEIYNGYIKSQLKSAGR